MDKPMVITDLMETWRDLSFSHFREGVDIHHIKRGSPALAILRYAPGAKVPLHLHTGLETILVLDGVQSDERGDYPKGSFILNPEGSTHWECPVLC